MLSGVAERRDHQVRSAVHDLGNVEELRARLDEAAKLLEQAYATRQDPEIAAHFGEVLWAQNKRDRAVQVWRQGLQADSKNATLLETLKRLNVKP